MKNRLLVYCFTIGIVSVAHAQGPPITADKPIMLGAKRKIIKTLTEIRITDQGTMSRIPFMGHYLPTSNSLVAVHIPLTLYDANAALGDIQLLGKYQFYRKDHTARTFRIVAKTLQTLPTGPQLGVRGISLGQYESYQGIVAAYESTRYGISNEFGFNLSPQSNMDELRYKLGFGLPLMKPSYPVNIVNLYFEYNSMWFVQTNEYMLLYAQGIQYAKDRLTIEAAIQVPFIQEVNKANQRKYSIFLGTRYVF